MSLITDADEWRAVFPDGYGATVVELDPGGRLRILCYDGEDLMYCSTHSMETAEEIADLLCRMAAHVRGDL